MESNWQEFPKETIEVTTGEAATLLGFDGIDGLEGWKIFKKIKRAFKKVGKAIKKVVKSKVFKIALPIAGVFLAPLAIAKVGSVAAKFGSKIGRLVGGGKTRAVVVKTASGAKAVGLVSPSEYNKLAAAIKSPTDAISSALFSKVTGAALADRVAENAKVVGNDVQLPVFNQPTTQKVETIPAKAAATAGIPAAAVIGGAALLALALTQKRR